MSHIMFLKVFLYTLKIHANLIGHDAHCGTCCQGRIEIHHAHIKAEARICRYYTIPVKLIIPAVP